MAGPCFLSSPSAAAGKSVEPQSQTPSVSEKDGSGEAQASGQNAADIDAAAPNEADIEGTDIEEADANEADAHEADIDAAGSAAAEAPPAAENAKPDVNLRPGLAGADLHDVECPRVGGR